MPRVVLAEIGDPYAAELLAARLRAEGIESHLSGEAEGPYRVTLGSMAVTRVWVDEQDLDDALAVLAEFED